MLLTIDDKIYTCVLDGPCAALRHAPEPVQMFYEVDASGYGIHWPILDLDLAIDPLIKSSIRQEKAPNAA